MTQIPEKIPLFSFEKVDGRTLAVVRDPVTRQEMPNFSGIAKNAGGYGFS